MKGGKKKSRTALKNKPTHRKELIGRVRRLLAELTSKYLSPVVPDDRFPSIDELVALREAVMELYIDQGRQPPQLAKGWESFLQVEKRYPTLRLTTFCDRLMRKLEALPVGPLSRITHEIERLKKTDNKSAEKLAAIVKLLDEDKFPFLSALRWADYYLLLRPFVTDGFEDHMISHLPGEKSGDRSQTLRASYEALGWAAFSDIWEQAKSWSPTHDPSGRVRECRFWVQVLFCEHFDDRLRRISRADSDVPTTREYKKSLARLQARLRQRKARSSK